MVAIPCTLLAFAVWMTFLPLLSLLSFLLSLPSTLPFLLLLSLFRLRVLVPGPTAPFELLQTDGSGSTLVACGHLRGSTADEKPLSLLA